jgi:hypothetical protein
MTIYAKPLICYSGQLRKRKVLSHIIQDQLDAHKRVLEELYLLDTETAECQFKIARFLLAHPKLAGITHPAADILRREQDTTVRAAAIEKAEEEMIKRSDVTSPTFRLSRRRLSENQIKKILHQLHSDKKPPADSAFSPTLKRAVKCPHCHNYVSSSADTRKKVVSFRTTEDAEDAIGYLAHQFGVSRSHLVNELLTVKRRFGCALKGGE